MCDWKIPNIRNLIWDVTYHNISSAENQKGVNADQRCSIENQKGAIAIDSVHR